MDIFEYLSSFIYYDDKSYKLRGQPFQLPAFLSTFSNSCFEEIEDKIADILISITNWCECNRIGKKDLEQVVIENGILTKDVESRWKFADYSDKKFQVIFIAYNCIPRLVDVIKMFIGGVKKGMINVDRPRNLCAIGGGPMLESIFFEILYKNKYNYSLQIYNYDLNDWTFSFNALRPKHVKMWSDSDFAIYDAGIMSYGISSNIIQNRKELCNNDKVIYSIESHGMYREGIQEYVPFDLEGAYGCYCNYSRHNFASIKYISRERNVLYDMNVGVNVKKLPTYVTKVKTYDAGMIHTIVHGIEEVQEDECTYYGPECSVVEQVYIPEDVFMDYYEWYIIHVHRYEYINKDRDYAQLNLYMKKHGFTYSYDCDKLHSRYHQDPRECECDITMQYGPRTFRIQRDKDYNKMLEDCCATLLHEVELVEESSNINFIGGTHTTLGYSTDVMLSSSSVINNNKLNTDVIDEKKKNGKEFFKNNIEKKRKIEKKKNRMK